MASTDYLDYPVGSPIRAQLQVAERANNLETAQAEYARARARRDEIRSLGESQRLQREAEERARREAVQPGFMGRMSDLVVHGVGKSFQAPFGFLYDVARAAVPGGDKLFEVLPQAWSERWTQQLNAWFGSRGVGGSLIGFLPPQVRDPAREGLQPVVTAVDATRREAMVEPLTRLLTGHAPFGGLNDLSGFDDPEIPNTVGRSVVSWWGGDSSKGWSQAVSGGLDVASAMFLDPAAIGGKAAVGVRTRVLESAGYGVVKDAPSLGKVVESKAFTDFTERAVVGKTAGEIRHSLLPNHPNGLQLATVLDEAQKAAGVDGVKLATRAMLGDPEAAAELAKVAEDAAVVLDNASTHLDEAQESIRAYRAGRASPPMRYPEYAHLVTTGEPAAAAAKSAATRELAMAKRAESIYGELDRIPRQTAAGRVRLGEGPIGSRIKAFERSDWVQASPFARPLQVVYEGGKDVLFGRLPKNRVNLNSPRSAVDLERMMRSAGLPEEEIAEWATRYGQTVNGTERRAVMEQAETTALKHLADQAGLEIAEVDRLLGAQRSGRAELAEKMTNRIYGGNGRDLLVLDEADRPLTEIHMFTETGAVDEFRLADFHQVRRVVSKWGQWKARYPALGLPISLAHEVMDIWRPLNLTTIRTAATIQMDQQFRIYLKLGALAQLGSIAKRGTRYIWDTVKGVEDEARGLRPFTYRGVTGPGPWGVTTEEAATIKALNSSRGVQKLLDSKEMGQRQLFGGWEDMGRTIYPTEASHTTELAKVLNNEIGDDAVNRMLLEGQSVDDVAAWLEGPEGQAYTKEVPIKRRDPRGWVESRAQHIEDMTVGNEELKALALDRNVRAVDIETELPDPATRPLVNRLLSDGMTGKSKSINAAQKLIDGFFRVVQSLPDDVLSRNTLYTELYDAEMTRLVDIFAEGKRGNVSIPDRTVARFAETAREKALAETKTILYDLADQSRAAEVLRLAVPFFEPIREQVTIYSQLASQAPQRFARARSLLRSPIRAGLVYDERGNQITEEGKHVDPLTGEEVPEDQRGERELLKFQLPSWARGVPWFGDVLGGRVTTIDLGTVRKKTTFPSEMSWGPTVQIPVNQVARRRPDAEESFRFLLPFGVTDDPWWRQLEPGFVKKFNDARSEADDNRTMRGAEAAAFLTKVTNFRRTTGRVPNANEKVKLEQESIDEAKAFMHLRFLANYVVPFSVGFETPYKPYADAYRAAQSAWMEGEKNKAATGGVNLSLADAAGNERDATQWFLDTFGDEYFALTQSVTRTTNGVPPTVGGMAAEKKYRDLIEKYPDLGGLIVGSEGAGEFNYSVYLNQLQAERAPGAGEKMRELIPLKGVPGAPGISTAPEINLGWHDYMAGMDLIDAERRKRGLPNLQVKGATDLAEAKRAFVEGLKEQYPAWRDEFESTDQGKWRRKIDGLSAIARDKRLAQRSEIQLLGTYLEGRQWMQEQLAVRRDKTLGARTNMDLALKWEGFTNGLVDENLAFADLFHRYLENDPVVAE